MSRRRSKQVRTLAEELRLLDRKKWQSVVMQMRWHFRCGHELPRIIEKHADPPLTEEEWEALRQKTTLARRLDARRERDLKAADKRKRRREYMRVYMKNYRGQK